jgi:membrane protein implicated in regulation of membrane protease activity
MPALENLGRTLMLLGGVLLVLGAILTFGGRAGWLGRLPGDFQFERGGVSFYFPVATCLILSLLLTLILRLFRRH